ncbi:MAG: pyridoxamine 5'-phosphate oxidase family protein [Chloroflexota bacterium]
MSARRTQSDLATEVWRDLAKRSFAVIAHVNDEGEPRSSGVVYALVDHHLFVAVAPDSWKARALQTGDQVSVTVPVPRGGLLSMLLPIPPATISFHARVTVHTAEATTRSSLPKELQRLLPETGESPICMLELTPEGRFLTYGVGVSLPAMRDRAIAAGHVPTG